MTRGARFWTFALALMLLAAGTAQAAEPARIALLSAFAPETRQILSRMEDKQTRDIAGVRFTLGRFAGREVVAAQSGISMVNAARTTQLLLDRFNVESIVFSGIAGGVNPERQIGDVVVAARWGQYLDSVFARETAPGVFTPPEYRGAPYPSFGMIFPQNVELPALEGKPQKKFWFEVDPLMLEASRRLMGQIELRRCTEQGACLGHTPAIVIGGNGVSGTVFVDNAAFREYVHATFQADLLDMESAAVGAVAEANAVPYIVFRSLSDLAGGGPGENEMATFLDLAAENSAAVVEAYIKLLPVRR